MNYVLDASAMIAYLRAETGGAVVRSTLMNAQDVCFAHAVNLCEVYYGFHRKTGETDADRVLEELGVAGVIRRDDLSPLFCRAAAALKSEFRRISLADCFALALARELDARFLTADHHELDAVAMMGRFDIAFIR